MQYCEWFIVFSEGETINLDFTAFDLEYDSTCQYDWLEVREGTQPSSSLVESLLCGYEIPGSITSKTNELYIRFSSDGSENRSGFEIQVTKNILAGIGYAIYALNNKMCFCFY